MASTAREERKVQYKISPEEMWDCIKGTSKNWGIDGYEVPRKYFDHYDYQWKIKRAEILNKPSKQWPPPDWKKDKESDKQIPPKRDNFIDDVIKLAKSYNDIKKSEELRQQLEPKGIFNPLPKKPIINARENYLKWEEEQTKRRNERPKIPEYKVNAIEQAQQKIQRMKEDEKPLIEKIKARYTKEKPLWPRCDRVTVMADAEYIGEQIPFYNTPVKEGEDPKSAKPFFPNVRLKNVCVCL